MNKKSKIIVALTMIMMVISMTTICFTFAWYDLFPKYHNLSLSTGKESLNIHSNVFLRTRDAQGNATFSETDNYKTVDKGVHKVGPDTTANPNPIKQPYVSEGILKVDFADLAFSIFGTANDNGIIPPGGTLDPNNMSWNMNYLTFAIIECRFYNQFFPAYLNSEYFSSVSVTSDALSSEYNIDHLFTINVLEDTTPVDQRTKTQMLGLASNADGTASTPDQALIKQLENNVVATGTTAKYLNSDISVKHGLFEEGTPSVNRQIEIQPNSNVDANGVHCYSYAYAIALGINAQEVFNIMNAKAGFKPTSTATLTFNLQFITQNTKGANA